MQNCSRNIILSHPKKTGVFGLSLSPVNDPPDRLLFFHPMSSYGVSEIMATVFN